jgi:hypothetical protein
LSNLQTSPTAEQDPKAYAKRNALPRKQRALTKEPMEGGIALPTVIRLKQSSDRWAPEHIKMESILTRQLLFDRVPRKTSNRFDYR